MNILTQVGLKLLGAIVILVALLAHGADHEKATRLLEEGLQKIPNVLASPAGSGKPASRRQMRTSRLERRGGSKAGRRGRAPRG